jgi:hypothetical protein
MVILPSLLGNLGRSRGSPARITLGEHEMADMKEGEHEMGRHGRYSGVCMNCGAAA